MAIVVSYSHATRTLIVSFFSVFILQSAATVKAGFTASLWFIFSKNISTSKIKLHSKQPRSTFTFKQKIIDAI